MDYPVDNGRRHILDGTIRVFLAESLIFPVGLVTAAILTRALGPSDYGLLTVAASLVAWIEWSIVSMLGRASVKFVGEADDWRAVGSTLLRVYLVVGMGAGVLLFLLAGPIASLFGEPELAWYFRLFSLDIPLFCLAYAHKNILVGRGGYRQRAVVSISRWLTRLILVAVLIGLGLSVEGAILATVGASLVELVVTRLYVRPPLVYHSSFPLRRLWGYALPLMLYSLSMRLFDKLDLFMLKALGGTADQAGVYGAAQNLALVPGIFALSFAPLLISSMSRSLKDGEVEEAHSLARDAMRLVLILFPLGALVAGSADELVVLIFGQEFLAAGPLLAALIFAALAILMIGITTAILTVAGKPGWTISLAGPLLLLAGFGHVVMIPRFGPMGAALVTTLVASLGGLMGAYLVYRLWSVLLPLSTLVRSIIIGVMAYAVAVFWSTPGWLLVVKLATVVLLVAGVFVLLGEFSRSELDLARSLLPWSARRDGVR